MAESSMYRLINPYINGTVNKPITAKNAFSAGKQCYTNLSSYITNPMDKFYITIENMKTGKLTNFEISERKDDDSGDIEFKLKMFKENLPENIEKELLKKVNELDTQGGGYFDSDSDSESSLYEYDCRDLINKYTYFYLPYTKYVNLSKNDYPHLFMPVFVYPIAPVTVVRFDLITL